MLNLHLPLALLVNDAQAGGGGSFGGGGGGSGGGSGGGGGWGGGGGGGDGAGHLIYWLIRLAFEVPLLGVPLLILVAWLLLSGSHKGWGEHQSRTIRRRRGARRANRSAVSADALRETDPDFDERGFLVRVAAAFHKAQDAWCAHDLEPLRPFVTDGVFERFSLQIAEQQRDGWRNELADLRIGRLMLAHVEAGAQFDTVTVRIPFHALIDRIELDTGDHMPGSRLPRESFVEMWSFLRRRGARTIDGEGLIEGKCPNCGAPLTLKQSAKCGSCECLARSGQFDWVLAEITQESVWSVEHERDIPGLAAYVRTDPGLSVQGLEDYASVAFWRKAAADRAARIEPLTRVGTSEFNERYAAELAVKKSYYADSAVGSVRTLGVLAGPDQDRVVLEVVWDGVRARLANDGSRVGTTRRHLHHTIFLFVRAAGAQTRLDDAFTTMHCRTCGAHDAGGVDPACRYCGSPRTGDRSTWLLSDVFGQHAPEARSLRAELTEIGVARRSPETDAPRSSTVELLEWSVALVRADGVVSDDEREAVRSLASRQDTPSELVDALLDGEDAPALDEMTGHAARERLDELVGLALEDGRLSKSEQRFLGAATSRLGLQRADLQLLIRRTRARLFRASRAAARHERRSG